MAKDKIRFRESVRCAHGAASIEDAIGITKLRTARGHDARIEDERSLRPTGLMKWSFDDFIIQETWPHDAFTQLKRTQPEGNKGAVFVLVVITEGVSDNAIASIIEDKCSCGTLVHFFTPLDFGSSQERHVLVFSPSQNDLFLFKRQQKFYHAEGVVVFKKIADISLRQKEVSFFPTLLLPELRYSIVLRGIRGSLADVLPRLEALQTKGFLNYSHLARHGVGLFRAFESGRQLLCRNYVEFLRGYVFGLTERSPLLHKEIPSLTEILADPKATRNNWKSAVAGLQYALKQEAALMSRPQTGLYYPHHVLLKDFLQRASYIAPKHHDSSQVIRESVSRLVIQEKLRSVADVHFNALASFRWEMYGDQVVPGDLVLPPGDATIPLDIFEAPADHINGEMAPVRHHEWLSVAGQEHMDELLRRVRVVQTAAEGREYKIDHVVLPVLGSGAEQLLFPNSRIKEVSERLAQELQIEGLPRMKAAPPATYRHLVMRPKDFSYYLFDEERGWDWESNNESPIKEQLYKDHEGITRLLSPLAIATGKKMLARSGISGVEQRSHFLKPARRSGMTCVLRMTLPRGSAVTSALREAFQFATLDPGAIFHLIR